MFVNKDIPPKYLQSFHLPGVIQPITLEINLEQCKLLVVSVYLPPDQNLDYFLSPITALLNYHLKSDEDFVITDAILMQMENFLNQHKCKNIINSKTCYKSQEGSCIDLIIASTQSLQQFPHVFESGISDHHLMVYTMLKSAYTKLGPKILRNRFYKDFNK